MSSEPFSPLLSAGFQTFFMWLFSIGALLSIIWFLTYINSSKNRDTRTLFSALMITTLTSALALTMIVVEYSLFS
ncbi:MAG: hypothetical protein VXX61_03530 [Asgard group archaeon]|nr:hypothetical protein [Asgard group archaeon]